MNAPAVPDDAILVGDDFYMVPAGVDPDGCPRFRAFAQRQSVPAVMFYRRRDGSFTQNKLEAQPD